MDAPIKKRGRPPLPADQKAHAITIKAHPVAIVKFKNHAEKKGQSHRQLFESITKKFTTTL